MPQNVPEREGIPPLDTLLFYAILASMVKNIQDLNSSEVGLLFNIIEKLSATTDPDSLRTNVGEDLLRLFRSDVLASYVWNDRSKTFGSYVGVNHDPSNVARYVDYYQFHDPVTFRIRERKRATVASEVIPQRELEKTEFFNDFLMRDKMHHGIAAHVFDGELDVGDLRIWRYKDRPPFGRREVELFSLLLPHFRNAMRNARIIGKVQGAKEFVQGLLEDTDVAVFVIDENGSIIHENIGAQEIEKDSSYIHFSSLCKKICLEMKEKQLPLGSKRVSISVLKYPSSDDPKTATAVLAASPQHKEIDIDLLRNKHHLSYRESEICLFVCKGLTDREIASLLQISFYTVRTHLNHVFEKLEVTTRTELVYVLLQ